MKNQLNIFLLLFAAASSLLGCQSGSLSQGSNTDVLSDETILGAWEWQLNDSIKVVKIVSADFFMTATYVVAPPRFIAAAGGTYTLEGNTLSETLEYHSLDTTAIGGTTSYSLESDNTGMIFQAEEGLRQNWKRIDEGNRDMNTLAGAWRITQRMNKEGEMQKMRLGSRKTIKILSGTRFQWAAFDVDKRLFRGTGGGSYRLVDGIYTEEIEFFSRDNTRVGAELTFQADVQVHDWLHSGYSSKGDSIAEIWTLEGHWGEEAEK